MRFVATLCSESSTNRETSLINYNVLSHTPPNSSSVTISLSFQQKFSNVAENYTDLFVIYLLRPGTNEVVKVASRLIIQRRSEQLIRRWRRFSGKTSNEAPAFSKIFSLIEQSLFAESSVQWKSGAGNVELMADNRFHSCPKRFSRWFEAQPSFLRETMTNNFEDGL